MELHQLFTTPVYENVIQRKEEAQKEIDSVVEILKQTDGFRLNLHSECHLLSDPTFEHNILNLYDMPIFKSELESNIKQYINILNPKCSEAFFIHTCWIALNRPGDYTHSHSHGSSDLSGVYYYKTKGDDGDLILENPNKLNSATVLFGPWQKLFYVKPLVGNLLLFPGWLNHQVSKNYSDEERISIAFNVGIKRG